MNYCFTYPGELPITLWEYHGTAARRKHMRSLFHFFLALAPKELF